MHILSYLRISNKSQALSEKSSVQNHARNFVELKLKWSRIYTIHVWPNAVEIGTEDRPSPSRQVAAPHQRNISLTITNIQLGWPTCFGNQGISASPLVNVSWCSVKLKPTVVGPCQQSAPSKTPKTHRLCSSIVPQPWMTFNKGQIQLHVHTIPSPRALHWASSPPRLSGSFQHVSTAMFLSSFSQRNLILHKK